ncbi:MAG: hypothetical protein Q9191_003757 [Dirinaria sp. TL-2023a]
MALGEVMEHMAKKHGFITSDKTYKRRIKEWGLGKNSRAKEMSAVARKFAERKAISKPSIFRIRGQDVDYAEMVRYFGRRRITIEDVMAQRQTSSTPEAVMCFIPLQSPISTPKVLALPESTFAAVRDFMNGLFDSGTWVKTEELEDCYSIGDGRISSNPSGPQYLDTLYSSSWEACDLHELTNKEKAKAAQDSAIAALSYVLPLELPRTLLTLLTLVANLFSRYTRPGVIFALFHAVAGPGELLLGQQHPLPRIAKSLCRLNESDFREAGVNCLRTMADGFGNNLGPMHWTSLVTYSNHATLHGLRELLSQCQANIGEHDFRTVEVRVRLLDELINERQYQVAERECHELLATVHMVKPPQYIPYCQAEGLYYLARCQKLLSERDLGVATLREAVDVRISAQGSGDVTARARIVELQAWLTELRRDEEAEEARLWYELIRNAPAELQRLKRK